MAREPLGFDTPGEFAAICAELARRLHAKNRIHLGESHLVWELAVLLDQIGQGLSLEGDPGVRAMFGDGCRDGTLPKDARRAELLSLLTRFAPG